MDITVECTLPHPPETVFAAWVRPEQLSRWRGSQGWHVEAESLHGDPRLGGSHAHVKVRDTDPSVRVSTDGIYTEFVEPVRFVSREQVVGDAGVDPDRSLDLSVDLTGADGGTLVRLTQGPYRADAADWHVEAWGRELDRLAAFLAGTGAP